MRLTVVGAGPAYSRTPGAVGACYLLESDGAAMALDLGQGAFAGLAARIRPEALASVFVSHLHPDHFVDLVAMRHWLRYHATPPARIRVDAPGALAARLDGLNAEPGFAAAALDVVALEPGIRAVGPFRLEVVRVHHTDDSYAVRATGNSLSSGLVYSGDLSAADDLQALVRPGDVLLIEVSFGPGPVAAGAGHLDGPAVGALAAATRPARVLLTHLLPDLDPDLTVASVRESFDGPVELVAPGAVFDW